MSHLQRVVGQNQILQALQASEGLGQVLKLVPCEYQGQHTLTLGQSVGERVVCLSEYGHNLQQHIVQRAGLRSTKAAQVVSLVGQLWEQCDMQRDSVLRCWVGLPLQAISSAKTAGTYGIVTCLISGQVLVTDYQGFTYALLGRPPDSCHVA